MIVTHIIRDRFILGLEFSPETIHAMDDEVEANEPEALTRLLFAHAARFLSRHWDTITEVAMLLLERGTLTEKEVAAVIQRPSPAAPDRPRMQ
jgi:ATP-dependent Zn protease